MFGMTDLTLSFPGLFNCEASPSTWESTKKIPKLYNLFWGAPGPGITALLRSWFITSSSPNVRNLMGLPAGYLRWRLEFSYEAPQSARAKYYLCGVRYKVLGVRSVVCITQVKDSCQLCQSCLLFSSLSPSDIAFFTRICQILFITKTPGLLTQS